MIKKAIESILIKIAWRMEIIAPGSMAHISLLILTAALAAAVFFFSGKIKCSKQKILFAEGILLVLMECIKQLFLTWVRGWDYSWSDFPFQLCSIPMYLMVFYPFLRTKGKRNAENFLMTFGMIGGIAALIEPVSIFTDYFVLTLHSVLWHMMLVITAIFLWADRKRRQAHIKGKAKAKKAKADKAKADKAKADKAEANPNSIHKFRKCMHDYQGAGLLYLCLAAAAVVINAFLSNISNGKANMFFLGPSWPDMFILNDIYSKYGWPTESILFAAVTWLAGLIVYLLFSI